MKWQADTAFVGWLLEAGYAEMRDGKVYPFLSGGVVLYCFEAWTVGRGTS
jgi:hypothetical protein